MKAMGVQRILCVRRAVLERDLARPLPAGLTADRAFFERTTGCVRACGEFLPRPDVEEDPAYLQPIVYGVVTDGRRVLALQRTERDGAAPRYVETRHNRLMGLACGGHVEPHDDIADPMFFWRAMIRELSEELVFDPPLAPRRDVTPVGILFLEETAFDRVHLGIIYRVRVRGRVRLPRRRDEYDSARLLRPDALSPSRDRMEGWGRVLADAILAGTFPLSGPAPASRGSGTPRPGAFVVSDV